MTRLMIRWLIMFVFIVIFSTVLNSVYRHNNGYPRIPVHPNEGMEAGSGEPGQTLDPRLVEFIKEKELQRDEIEALLDSTTITIVEISEEP